MVLSSLHRAWRRFVGISERSWRTPRGFMTFFDMSLVLGTLCVKGAGLVPGSPRRMRIRETIERGVGGVSVLTV